MWIRPVEDDELDRCTINTSVELRVDTSFIYAALQSITLVLWCTARQAQRTQNRYWLIPTKLGDFAYGILCHERVYI